MEGERERLNQRILALSEKLADVKFANSVGTFNVRFFFNSMQTVTSQTYSGQGRKTMKGHCRNDLKIFWYSS